METSLIGDQSCFIKTERCNPDYLQLVPWSGNIPSLFPGGGDGDGMGWDRSTMIRLDPCLD
jgi:hypothetical protein